MFNQSLGIVQNFFVFVCSSFKSDPFSPDEIFVETGKVKLTPYVKGLVEWHGFDDWKQCLTLHRSGNWGQVDSETWKENDHALKHGGRLLSRWELRHVPYTFGISIETNAKRTRTIIRCI